MSTLTYRSIADQVAEYRDHGWQITTSSDGATYDRGWTDPNYSATPEECANAGGVGIKTGRTSNNLVVIDPDTEIAEKAADRFLRTLRSGHSNKWTHGYFTCPDLPEKFSRQFTSPGDGVIVEILADKKRVEAPPSKHKSGNPRYWNRTDLEPTTATAADVLRWARMIATVYWLDKYIPEGSRHPWSLSAAAVLMKQCGVHGEDVYEIFDALYEIGGYYEENKTHDTLPRNIRNTWARFQDDPDSVSTSVDDTDLEDLPAKLREVWKRSTEEKAQEAWGKCAELATKPDILAETYKLCQSAGLVGEETNAKLLTLMTVTRAMRKPISGIVEGNTSAGKSFTLKLVLDALPEDAKYELQSMSDKALAHIGKHELTDKFLVLYELGGIGSKDSDALEMVKQLLTEGRIRRLIANSTQRGVEPKMLETEGPTGLLTTTTRYKIDDELTSRVFKLKVDDSPAQNKRVVNQLFNREARKRAAPDFTEVRALHTWLYGQDNRVDVPFLDFIGESIPAADTRIRRDASKIIDLVEAHAVLHQASRERNAAGEIVATLEDYAAVRALVEDIIGEGSEVKVHPKVRETVEMARKLLEEDVEISPSNMAKKLGTTSQNAGRRLGTAESKEYLKLSDSGHSRRKVYVMGEKMPDDSEMLPTVEAIQEKSDVERLNGSNAEGEERHESGGNVSPTTTVQRTVQQRVSNRSIEGIESSNADTYKELGHVEESSEAGIETNRSTVQRDEDHDVERVQQGTLNGSLNGSSETVEYEEYGYCGCDTPLTSPYHSMCDACYRRSHSPCPKCGTTLDDDNWCHICDQYYCNECFEEPVEHWNDTCGGCIGLAMAGIA